LFSVSAPGGENFVSDINKDSLVEYDSFIEPAALESPQVRFQFERLGYFSKDESAGVFNQAVSLREGS